MKVQETNSPITKNNTTKSKTIDFYILILLILYIIVIS